MGKYTIVSPSAYGELVLGGGVLARDFDIDTGSLDGGDIIALTDSVNFSLVPILSDMGRSSNNCPKNAQELARLDGCKANLKGRMYSLNGDVLALLYPTASFSDGEVSVGGRISSGSFSDLWFIADYSCVDGEGGYLALKLKNAISDGGIQLATDKSGKGYLSFSFTGHISADEPKSVPFELYLKKQ